MNPYFSDRLKSMPPYIFSEINRIKADATRKGISLLSLAIGDPDQPTPDSIVEVLKKSTESPKNHAYSPYEGTEEFRGAIATWFQTRFGVTLDGQREVVALIGSKEGLAHFPLAVCNPGDRAFFPSPGYPIFQTSLLLAGAKAIPLPMKAADQFLPNLDTLETMLAQHRPKLMILNFPSNPTSAQCPISILEKVVALAKQYGTIIAYDNAYSEIYLDEKNRPVSILEVPGAREIAIEFHSFSKTFNMTGWRIGFAVGNANLVEALLKVKTNVDSGPLLAVQEAAKFAIENESTIVPPIRELYAKRIGLMLKGLDRLGIEYMRPQSTFFVWSRVPGGMKSMDFCRKLIEESGLVVTPGIGFGEEGEHFFRMSLTVSDAQIQDALHRLEKSL